MIFGNLKFNERYNMLDASILKCFEYAKNHDLKSFDPGSYAIDEDRIFVNIVEYTTTTTENRFWEAHKRYIDMHLMLEGIEQIDLNFIDNMTQKEFVLEDDFLPLEGLANSLVQLGKEDFLICYPEDAHRTAIQVDEPIKIKKAIFKVQL